MRGLEHNRIDRIACDGMKTGRVGIGNALGSIYNEEAIALMATGAEVPTLDLGCCGIDVAGARRLAAALKLSTTTTSVNVQREWRIAFWTR